MSKLQLVSVTRMCLPRITLPQKPPLTESAIGGVADYAEMSSRYKACHMKGLIWWISFVTRRAADNALSEAWPS